MNLSKTVVLMLGGSFTLLGLGLMFASAAEKQLGMNPDNSIHHVQNVVLLSGTTRSILKNEGNMVLGIEANNFVISQTGNTVANSMLSNTTNSSILGGIKNEINGGGKNVILGGQSNKISKEGSYNGNQSTVLGGSGNTIMARGTLNKSSDYSVILGGLDNELKGSYSVVGGENNKVNGDYSIALGKGNRVIGSGSVALGSGGVIKADKSFLWTDGNQNRELVQSNVFAVVAKHGVVVNTGKAHSYAQLTIGGPLVVYKSAKDLGECNIGYKGVLKVVEGDSSQKCFCSCDGTSWHSLYGQGTCVGKCDTGLTPDCGTEVSKRCSSIPYSYSGSCNIGKIEEGTGAYVVTMDNVVHWSCQTNNGKVAQCSGTVINPGC